MYHRGWGLRLYLPGSRGQRESEGDGRRGRVARAAARGGTGGEWGGGSAGGDFERGGVAGAEGGADGGVRPDGCVFKMHTFVVIV